MAYRQHRGYENQRQRHDLQLQQYQYCRDLGITYPPTADDVYRLIQMTKGEAERALHHNDLVAALNLYTSALRAVSLKPDTAEIEEEYHKLLSNRSLIYYKQAKYREAKLDAQDAIDSRPSFIKAYWRAAQACCKLPHGSSNALPYLVDGLRLAQTGQGTTEDTILFLTELCVIMPKAPITDKIDDTLLELIVPTSDVIWNRVFQKLVTNGNWEGLAMIVIGEHSGPASDLDSVISDHQFDSVSVGTMLKAATDSQLRAWGIKLAIAMLQQGASYDEIGQPYRRPTVHIGVDIALRTGRLDLLKCIFEKYSKSPEKKNAQDLNGRTAYHCLIQSGQANTTVGETVLRVLINHRCNPMIHDNLKKLPVAYLTPNDSAYTLLMKAGKTDEELRAELDSLKARGNSALKAGQHQSALALYSQALDVAQQSSELFKEAAILYSNQANVLSTQKQYTEALTNALAAISCDATWHKGYWWKGQVLKNMASFPDSFSAFLEGFSKAQCTADIQTKFLVEAALLLDRFDTDVAKHYKRLFIDKADWPSVLACLGRDGEWKTIAYLAFGTDLSQHRFKSRMTQDLLRCLCVGVAGSAATTGVPIHTVFPYLRQQSNLRQWCAHWVDAAVYFVFNQGTEPTLQSFCCDDKDTPIHASVRFSLMTGRTSMIHEFPDDHMSQVGSIQDGAGDSLYHVITKFRPLPETLVIQGITETLIKKGFSTMVKDRAGKLAVEYLDKKYPGYIYDIFFKPGQNFSLSDINKLKNEGNVKYKAGDMTSALDLYSKAIHIFKTSPSRAVHNTLSNHEIAVLYGNRAEAYLKMKDYKKALDDSVSSVSFDGHWYKAHVRVGKAQRGLCRNDLALKAFINSYSGLSDKDEDRVKVEVLLELAPICQQIPRGRLDIHQCLPEFPRGQGTMWAKTAYELVTKDAWDTAAVAYFQYRCGEASNKPIAYDLRPLCNLGMLKGYPWGLDLILFFLGCGSDRTTITVDQGDTYLHAIVRMTLLAGRNCNLLEFVVKKFTKLCKEENIVDIYGNTALHTATKERGVAKNARLDVIIFLLKCNIDPMVVNQSGLRAKETLPPNETQSHEHLRMAMYKTSLGNSARATPPPPTNIRETYQETKEPAPKMPSTRSARKECDTCDDLYSQAAILMKDENIVAAYKYLTDILAMPHKTAQHEKIAQKSITLIANRLGETLNPQMPTCLTEIGTEYYSCVVDKLANGNKWYQLHSVVRKYRAVNGSDKLKGFGKSLSVVPVVRDASLKGDEELKLQIVSNLLNSGATMGTDGGQSALGMAVNMAHYKVLRELIKRGADTAKLSFVTGDTAIHAAVLIALEEKSLAVLKLLLQQYQKNPEKYAHLNPDQLDSSGDCLFHLVAKVKYSSIALHVVELLCKTNISSRYTNKEGKLPIDYILKKSDRRLQYLRLASSVEPSITQANSPEKGSTSDSEDFQQFSRSDETDAHELREVVRVVSEKEKRKRRIGEIIRLLPDSEASIFSLDHSPADKVNIVDGETDVTDSVQQVNKGLVSNTDDSAMGNKEENEKSEIGRNVDGNIHGTVHVVTDDDNDDTYSKTSEALENDNEIKNNRIEGNAGMAPKKIDAIAADAETVEEDRQTMAAEERDTKDVVMEAEVETGEPELESDDDSEDEGDDLEDEFTIDAELFDNLEWEVECTADVWKTLRDKHVPPELKRRVVRKVQLLASGEWQPVLCKRLRNVPTALKLNLFEAKFSRGSRILWELAVAFSPRCSQSAETRLQSDESAANPVRGGRIYSEIIRVWDIVLDHDKIYRSVERIKKSHQRGETCIIQKKLRGIKSENVQLPIGAAKRFPKLYAEAEVATNTLEEQVQYFPPASANDTEYHILKFYSFSSTLVSHVLQNIETKVDFPFRVTDLEHAIINLRSRAPILLLGRSGTGKTTCCLYRLWSQFHAYWSKAKEADAPLLPRCVEFIHEEETEIDSGDEDLELEGHSEDEEGGACGTDQSDGSNEENEPMGQQYDHIHQIFITKNAVLCSEVMKNFRELSHANELMQDRVAHEEENLPNYLHDVEDVTYPLFVTSRQLLLMLDASIGAPHFFERKADGSLKVEIVGWSDLDGPLSFLPLLDEDSDAEEDDTQYVDDSDGEHEELHRATAKKAKVDPRREITYDVFVEEIWPRIKKKVRVSYHPSLIWVEIMSFIKGSYEALSKPCGYLKKDEYIKLGRKRAPNFSGERDKVYEFYTRYEHFKTQNQLFDETDLVHDVFRRLQGLERKPWVIHQIYVDETQDFTQAELCLLIRLCQNPNHMFLTGDTAQSIMRGISFRFSDLRSLFYHAKQSMHAMGKTSAVEVPKQVYQLTHNYRSHAGILGLASSILELMVEFFPESFDRLSKDQGLFHGPQPLLLESCSFSDLAVLLRGNKRKTSHIEFGAHQAILVVNDAAREAIPEELRLGLVLTIYEAKGLEFDDVLLYNFFKDSQACKEWRVVTDFLERMLVEQTDGPEAGGQDRTGLTQIDEAVLHEAGRPRPLTFDANLHKVLNSELKHLYTALTRARVNVWIFDEDTEKRAPMFEYVKARKLVKCMTVSEIDETSLTETMFAERSCSADWVKRGEDFMKHALYTVAAKCFGMAEDYGRQKIALAHGQALKASRLRDNPRQMRDEFLHASELYLECGKSAKAAICLQNARERELAAQLFEKLGQYERAAETYRRMKRPLASSRCYEQLGQFDRAIEVLHENESYDMAIDSLRRYEWLVRDLQEKGGPLPAQLITNKPDKYYTEEGLSYSAAELYHKYKNEERMMDALDRLHKVSDRVNFLKKKGYITHAAEVLEQNDELEEASKLLLIHGRWQKALIAARKTLNEATIANCLLIASRVIIVKSRRKHGEIPTKELVSWLNEAIEMFKTCGHWDGMGEAQLLLADLSGDLQDVESAWKDFKKSKPFVNEAGLVECTDWLVRQDLLDKMVTVKCAVQGVGHLFNVCEVLLEPNSPSNREKSRLYDQYYGLSPSSQTTLMIYQKEKPQCMDMMREFLKGKTGKHPQVEVSQTDANITIVQYLLIRATAWLEPIWNALSKLRSQHVTCEYFQVGLECPDQKDVENLCPKLHTVTDKQHYSLLIQMDILLLEYEYNIQHGAKQLRLLRSCTPELTRVLESYGSPGETRFDWKYKTCKMLLNDLMPASQHPQVINDDARELVSYLSEKTKVQNHMRNYLQEMWSLSTGTGNRSALGTAAAKSTNDLLMFFFNANLFGLTEPPNTLNPVEQISRFENRLTLEVGSKVSSLQYLALIKHQDKDGRILQVQCLARRFIDAYQLLSKSSADPYEAVFKFCKFVIILGNKGKLEFFPDMKHFLFWFEFFSTVTFFLIARLKAENFPDFAFVLPANYLALVKFVEATFPRSNRYPVQERVFWWNPSKHQTDVILQDRLKYLAFTLSGLSTSVKIFRYAFQERSGQPCDYALAERLLVLGMVYVCNIGKAVPMECESSLLLTMRRLAVPDGAPARLCQALAAVKAARGITDIATALQQLLAARRDGTLLVCRWIQTAKKDHIEQKELQNMSLFSDQFLNKNTVEEMKEASLAMKQEYEQRTMLPVEGTELTMEEIQRGQRDQHTHQVEELRKRSAARIIIRFLRWLVQARRDGLINLPSRRNIEVEGETDQVFSAVQVDMVMCGYCGVSFEQKLSELLLLEQSQIIGAKSVMNQGTSQNATSLGTSHNLAPVRPTSPGVVPTSPSGMSAGPGGMPTSPGRLPTSPGIHPVSPGGFASLSAQGPWGQATPTRSDHAPWGESTENWPSLSSQSQVAGTSPTIQQHQVSESEIRQKKLESVRNDHVQSQEHIQKKKEFQRFHDNHCKKYSPTRDKIMKLLNDRANMLTNPGFRESQYYRRNMEIDRMFGNCRLIDQQIQMMMAQKTWSDCGRIEQAITELNGDYDIVLPFVQEVLNRVRQEEEERSRLVSASSSATSIPPAENWDDELRDDIEEVVDAPAPKPRAELKSRYFRSRRYQRR